MAVDRANIIPICNCINGKACFLTKTSLFYIPLVVEISGIEPLTS